jgi:CheY-like chemotaxis protein
MAHDNKLGLKQILVLEDEPLMNDLVKHYCSKLSFPTEVISYKDPLDALRDPRFDKSSVDVMIVDILLPHMNAYEFLSNVKERTNGAFPNVVAITAIANDQLIQQLKTDYRVRFLKKPFKKQDFLDVLAQVIQSDKAA